MTIDRDWRSPQIMLACGALILAVSLGVRHGFGLFLQPVTSDSGWGREVFALGIALQNLIWGATQPFTGMLADRIGAGKVILGGALLYAGGLVLMAIPQDPTGFVLSASLVGLGLSGTTFPIVFGAISRSTSLERRSLVMGIAMAVGSFGQFIMLPGTYGLMSLLGWSGALLALALLSALIIPLSFALFERREPQTAASSLPAGPSAGAAIRDALQHRGFWLLSLGFFVCGFQVVFIAVHLPAFLADKGLSTGVGSTVLALIGLVNVAGTYYAGLWGGRYRKPMLLAWIYLGRAAAIALFVLLPVTTLSGYAFGITIGLFWLSTVPLTNGTVASLFGVKNMSMLAGVVFFAHQLGSFLGGWLGGYLYDRLGSYDAAWGLAIGLSLVAGLLNLPIREQPAAVQPARAKTAG
jgi:MFS family permease